MPECGGQTGEALRPGQRHPVDGQQAGQIDHRLLQVNQNRRTRGGGWPTARHLTSGQRRFALRLAGLPSSEQGRCVVGAKDVLGQQLERALWRNDSRGGSRVRMTIHRVRTTIPYTDGCVSVAEVRDKGRLRTVPMEDVDEATVMAGRKIDVMVAHKNMLLRGDADVSNPVIQQSPW